MRASRDYVGIVYFYHARMVNIEISRSESVVCKYEELAVEGTAQRRIGEESVGLGLTVASFIHRGSSLCGLTTA